MKKPVHRRQFLKGVAQAVAGGAILGGGWSQIVSEAKSAPLALRPPGALEHDDFLAACIKCGVCVEVCPYDTLYLGAIGSGAPWGTPTFEPRAIPCEMCEDIPCARKCPTGALDNDMEDINTARMGVAVLDDQSCISIQGLRCEACYRACPLIDKALKLVLRPMARTGVHAFFEPVIDPEVCTGCGKCEHACIMEVSAIKVRPLEVAQGKIGKHFRIGWEHGSEVTNRKGEKVKKHEMKKTKATGLDYLNNSEEDLGL
ncbi:MAG: ferredoxin-type protein NapG [Acidobacteria bacterium]|nr:MAG: ferredoxin-type protein NapG [Acidobacteriota bacterium]PIE91022.1 MAG: ferredoxin-type protein NapG [Acidobacteriota bacterium]